MVSLVFWPSMMTDPGFSAVNVVYAPADPLGGLLVLANPPPMNLLLSPVYVPLPIMMVSPPDIFVIQPDIEAHGVALFCAWVVV
jgi:hypothetical protein